MSLANEDGVGITSDDWGRLTDDEVREARDVVIIKMREAIPPFRRRNSWREIGEKVCMSHVGAWKRYGYLARKYPSILEAVRDGRLG